MRINLCNLQLMKYKVNLIIALMTACTTLILGLQLYWNYQAYKSSVRVFKSDINDVLEKSINRMEDFRRDEFATQYKKWLADTNLIVVSAKYSAGVKSTIYSIRDKHQGAVKRPPFTISFKDLPRIDSISPAAKVNFINMFAKNVLYHDLRGGSTYYYTDTLGDLMSAALQKDLPDTARLRNIYMKELAKRNIDNDFQLVQAKYTFKGFAADNQETNQELYSTRSFKYAFGHPAQQIAALFPNPNLVLLRSMKWVLLNGLLLFALTIGCFIYTIKTIRSQQTITLLKDDFVNNMTHELKTPVATIGIAAEAIQDFKLSEKATSEYLGIIRQQSSHLTNLIDQILKSGTGALREHTLDLKNLSVSELVAESIKQFEPQLSERNAKINLLIDPSELFVMGDESHLSNVLINILDNAVKYGSHPLEINLNYRRANNNLIIRVSNNGSSIPPEFKEKIFERFFRIPTGNLHNVKGYGLGLSYSRDIIKKHKGTLTLSTAEQLTTFTIQLPLS